MNQLKKTLIAAGALLLVIGLVVLGLTLKKNAYEKKIVELQNQVAERDKTIETKEGVFQKLTLQNKNLEKLLDDKDLELREALDLIDQQNGQLLTATKLVAKLRKDLEAKGDGVVLPPKPEDPSALTVSFDINLPSDAKPLFNVKGHTTGDCKREKDASAFVSLKQVTPIRFSLIVSQDKDKTWRTTVTSSDENFEVDIALAAVNPYMLEQKWYEKISLNADVGIGTNPGFLAGVGASYAIGKFEVGPRVWAVLDRGASAYFGASLTWHPFQK